MIEIVSKISEFFAGVSVRRRTKKSVAQAFYVVRGLCRWTKHHNYFVSCTNLECDGKGESTHKKKPEDFHVLFLISLRDLSSSICCEPQIITIGRVNH